MKHRIILRADGSATVGFGHVHRLLSLTQMLCKNFDCVFVSHETPEFLVKELKLLSVPLKKVPTISYKLPDERKQNEEVDFDMNEIVSGDEIVVLDGYWFGQKYQTEIKNKGCTLVYIDDLLEAGNIADIIINHSLGINISDYKMIAPATCIYTGSNYSLINVPAEFRHQNQNKNLYNQLLISMGGADPLNFTKKIIEQHKEYISRFEKVIVMVGVAYKHLEELKNLVAGFSNIQIIQAVPKTEMFSIMQQSTAAIISASTMSVEYANVGGVLAIIQTADNQKFLYKGLIEAGLALPVENIASLNDAVIELMKEKQQTVFDGRSNKRFIKLFDELQIQQDVTFIKAGTEHLQATFEWASDATVRAYSFNQNPISFEEHKNWYLKKIEQPNCMYLLAKCGNEIVGSLRFDITNNDALISYLVSPAYHGKGLGRILLAKGLDYLAKHNNKISTARGLVMPQNIASVKVFERLGFSCTEESNQLKFTKNIYR
ncbi:MAG: UDP-2,4-diacetamido-2,4,6-trideoxy-beta-L-altropyranose hydrolase [Bacteroidota bacterium]